MPRGGNKLIDKRGNRPPTSQQNGVENTLSFHDSKKQK